MSQVGGYDSDHDSHEGQIVYGLFQPSANSSRLAGLSIRCACRCGPSNASVGLPGHSPVIVIESLYVRLRLGTGWRNTLVSTSKANVITLLLGFPLAWLLYLVFEFGFFGALAATGITGHLGSVENTRIGDLLTVALSAAWMGPGIAGRWVVPLAFVVLLVPSFLVSGYVESALLGRCGWLTYEGRSTKVVWQANVFSYVFLAVAGCVLLWTQLGHI
jgi:hypothetical protein